MYNVLDTLKKIENPTEDQKAAIKSAEMTTPQAFPETQGVTEVSTTGDNLYAQYGKDAHADLIKLADVPVINVQSDAPETTTTESVEIEEAQSPAQKAAFQKMLDAKKDKKEDKDEVEEDDNTPEDYSKNEKVEEDIETIELDEAYDAKHVADIVAGHEKQGHKVQMDRPEDDGQGFTVTFKDGKRRHYKYSQAKTKVDSLEPVDPLVDPNAPKRERGRPKKEGLGEAEPAVLDTAFVTMEGKEEIDITAMFEAKLNESVETEEVAESLQVVQNIDDDNQETVSVNAQGEHTDMLKTLLNLSGQRSDGYEEYKGEEEAVEEERDIQHANTPNEQITDVDTQLNTMSGGLNGPKHKSAAKSNSNPLYNESITDEKMLELYKAYKGNE
jgi:hypothetical protein